jgi:CxxC motif-containing protein
MKKKEALPETAREIVCIVCPNGCRIQCTPGRDGYTFAGNKCKRGAEYANAELTRPMRTLTSSVRTVFLDAPVVSVRTDGEIEKTRIPDVLNELKNVTVDRRIQICDVVIENVCGSGVNVVCTTNRLVERIDRLTKGANKDVSSI